MKHKTIGDEITKLVKRYGNYTTGLYILERALQVSLGAGTCELVKVGDKLVSEHPRYLELRKQDEEALKRLNELINKDKQ